MSVQRIVEESPAIELQSEVQYTEAEIEEPVRLFLFSLIISLLCKNFN